MEQLSAVASIAALIASLFSVYVVLYVRAAIAPVITRIEEHDRLLQFARNDHGDMYSRLNHYGERLARLEARLNGESS